MVDRIDEHQAVDITSICQAPPLRAVFVECDDDGGIDLIGIPVEILGVAMVGGQQMIVSVIVSGGEFRIANSDPTYCGTIHSHESVLSVGLSGIPQQYVDAVVERFPELAKK